MTTPTDDQPTTLLPDDAAGTAAPTQTVEPPRRRSGLRWGIALVAVALIIGATAATLFLLSGSSTPSTVSRWVPTGSYFYMEARLDLPGDQRQGLANFLSHFPGFDDQAIFDQKIDEALDRILGESSEGGVIYTRDVKPWLGDSVAMVASRAPTDPTATKGAPVLVVVATKDAAAARSWLASQAELAGTTESYGGADIIVPERQGSELRYGFAVPGEVLLAGDVESIRQAIDTKGGSTFAGSERYRTARAAVPGDQAAFFFVDLATALEGLKGMPGLEAIPADQLAKVPAWMAGGIRFESDAVLVQTALPKIEGAPPATDRVSELAPTLPADTVLALEGHAIGEYVKATLDNLRSNPQTKAGLEEIESQAALLGGLESFYAWIGDGTLVVAGSGTEYRGGLVVKVADEEALRTKLLSIKNLVALAGGSSGITFTDKPYADGTITTLDLGNLGGLGLPGAGSAVPSLPSAPTAISYTQQRGLFVIGIGDAFVRSVLDARDGDSLAEQPRYKAAVERAGAANFGQAYVDVSALVGAASVLVPEAERATFEREYLPYLRPFAALAAAGQSGDPMRTRTVVIVQ